MSEGVYGYCTFDRYSGAKIMPMHSVILRIDTC